VTNPFVIDPSSPIPIYFQLKTVLLEQIGSGHYGPADRLPTEQQLCEMLGVSRTPVHRALAELADEGVVIRRRRTGTFVNPEWRAEDVRVSVLVTEEKWVRALASLSPEGITVDVGMSASLPHLHDYLTDLVGRGEAPDIALLDSVWVTEFARSGFIVPLDVVDPEWVDSIVRPEVVPRLVESLTVGGHLYAVPEEANVSGVWYRRDVLEGHAPPATWDDLWTVLVNAGDLVFAGGTLGGETTTYWLAGWLASNGVEILSDSAVLLDSSAATEAMRYLRRLVDAGVVDAKVVGLEWDRPPVLLAEGAAGASFGGSYEAGTLARLAGVDLDSLSSRFVFGPFPAGPSGAAASVLGGMVYVVFRQSEHPAAAVRLLRHILDPEVLGKRSRGEPTVPPLREARDELAGQVRFVGATAALVDIAVARPAVENYSMVSAQLQRMVESVLTGRTGPAAAVERTAEMLSAITGLPRR